MEEYFSNELIDKFEKMLEKQENCYFDASEFAEIIEYYLDIADYEYAKKAITLAFEQFPDFIPLKIKLLEFYVGTKNLPKANDLIEELQDLVLNDTDFYLAQAQYWSLKKNHKKAIKFYTQSLENKEEVDYIHNCIGNEYLDLKETLKALQHFQMSLQFNPKDEYAFFSTIHCYEDLHKLNECIDFLNLFIDENPYSENAWFQLGLKYIQQKLYTEAYQAFDFAYVINPKGIVNYMQKAFCLEQLNYYEEAILVYREAMHYEDSSSYILQQIGACFSQMKQPLNALKAYLQAIQEDPQIDNSWFEASLMFEKIGNYKDALYHIKKAIELDGDNAAFVKNKTYLNIKLQNFEEAIIDFNKLISLEPFNFNNHFAYSELLISIGEILPAIDLLERNKEKFDRAELYYQLSHCYFFVQEKEKAEASLEKAYALNPNIISDMTEKYPHLSISTNKIIKK